MALSSIGLQNATTLPPLINSSSAQPSLKTSEDSGWPAKSIDSPQTGPSVIVTISAEAKAAASIIDAKDFAAVTSDARVRLDSGYAKLKEAGIHFDFTRSTQAQWETLFGDMDRRSLYAVASNSGGQFSEIEQDLAQSFMSMRASAVMKAADPLDSNHPAAFKAYVKYLDGASPEEKTSTEWLVQRATAQYGYEESSKRRGWEPENLDSGNPLVNMILSALKGLEDEPTRAIATGAPVKHLMEMPLFRHEYFSEDTRNTAIAASTQME